MSFKFRSRKIIVAVILLAGLWLLGYGVWGLWSWYHATHNSHPVIPTKVITQSTDKPDETPPTAACQSYKVAAGEPRQIQIPRVDISGCIQRVGIDQNQSIAAPTNVFLAGWYVNSVLPGDKGVSLIDGHVHGRYSEAIFGHLKDLVPGDEIKIQRGDETWLTYKVIDTSHYPVNEVMANLFAPLSNVDGQLNLITCFGTYDSQQGAYDQRIIVRAKLE